MDDTVKLLHRLHKEAFAWAMQCCDYHRDNAMDALQESYLKVLEGRAIFNEKSTFKTWLFAVIRHTCLDQKRRQTNYRRIIEGVKKLVMTTYTKVDQQDQPSEIQLKLRLLSAKQQEVISLVFFHDLTIESAAEVMEVSLGTARTHYERGKARLKKLMETKKQLTGNI